MANKTVTALETATNVQSKLNNAIEVDTVVRLSRYEICSTCEHLNKQWLRCDKCMCWMPVKARLPGTKCPLNKW